MTLRDDKRLQRARLDPLRNSRGAELLTRPIDLARKWSYVTDVRLHKGCLVWSHAQNNARFFYEAMGGQKIAERTTRLGGAPVPEVGFGWKRLAVQPRRLVI